MNDWDIGVLDMQTAAFEDLPSENFRVFRIKKKVINPYSYAGGMLTSRIGVDGSYNLAYGIDAVIKVFGSEYLTVRWAQTFDEQTEVNLLSLKPARYIISWDRRRNNGLSYSIVHNWSGVDFDPGIGLERVQNYYLTRAILKYTYLSPESSPIHSHYFSATAYHLSDVTDNHVFMAGFIPGWSFTSKSNWRGTFNLMYNYQFLEQNFMITENVFVEPGAYNYFNTSIIISTPSTLQYKTDIVLSSGQYYDGFNFSPKVEPSINIGASVELGGIYQFDYVKFGLRNQQLANHIFGLRTLCMFSTRFSLSAFIQYNTAIDKVISNIRFRYNPKEGTDLYIVFNEGRNTYLDRVVPAMPAYDARSLMLKFTYTFNL